MKRLPELEYISVAETKAKLSEKLRNIEKRGRRFAITSHGKPKAVLISYKEFLFLNENPSSAPSKKISLDQWKKKKNERKKVIESVASKFEESKLTRKGQKRYKRDVVKKIKK